MNTRYKLFKWLRSWCEYHMQENYLKPNGGCDSSCPNCKAWESLGNSISTTPLDDGSDQRKCGKCGYSWLALFTPAGFIPIDKTENVMEVPPCLEMERPE